MLLFAMIQTSSSAGLSRNNIDVLEPLVRKSPATVIDGPNDLFGWATVLHQVEAVQPGDSLSQAISKTRFVLCIIVLICPIIMVALINTISMDRAMIRKISTLKTRCYGNEII